MPKHHAPTRTGAWELQAPKHTQARLYPKSSSQAAGLGRSCHDWLVGSAPGGLPCRLRFWSAARDEITPTIFFKNYFWESFVFRNVVLLQHRSPADKRAGRLYFRSCCSASKCYLRRKLSISPAKGISLRQTFSAECTAYSVQYPPWQLTLEISLALPSLLFRRLAARRYEKLCEGRCFA